MFSKCGEFPSLENIANDLVASGILTKVSQIQRWSISLLCTEVACMFLYFCNKKILQPKIESAILETEKGTKKHVNPIHVPVDAPSYGHSIICPRQHIF